MRQFVLFATRLLALCSALWFGVPTSHADAGNWSRGTGLNGGEVTALASAPTGELYASVVYAGAFISRNGGASWSAWSEGLPQDSFARSLHVDAGGNVFADVADSGIYRRGSGDTTWVPARKGLPTYSGGDVYYLSALQAAPDNGLYVVVYGSGIYKSSDRGENWVAINQGLPPNGGVSELALDQQGRLYASAYADNRLYRSDNGGASWAALSATTLPYGFARLRFGPDGTLYALTQTGVVKSSDGAQSWQAFASLPNLPSLPPSDFGTSYFSSFKTLSVDDDGTLYLGARAWPVGCDLGMVSVYQSSDQGRSWQALNQGLPAGGTVLNLARAAGGSLYAGTNGGGVYQLARGVTTWAPANSGLPAAVNALAVVGNGRVYAASDNGVFFSDTAGASWVAAGAGLSNLHVRALALGRDGELYAGAADGAVFVSRDGASSWTQRFRNTNCGYAVNALAVGADGGLYIGSLRDNLRKLSADGSNSQTMSVRSRNITAFANSSNGTMYAGGALALLSTEMILSGGMYQSLDQGTGWLTIEKGLIRPDGHGFPPSIHALAWRGSGLYAATDNGVYQSYDQGANWWALTNGLPRSAYNDLVQPSNGLAVAADGSLYASVLGKGVYQSRNGGHQWQPTNQGLASTLTKALAADQAGNVYVATMNAGVWQFQSARRPAVNVQSHSSGSLATFSLRLTLQAPAASASDQLYVFGYLPDGSLYCLTPNGWQSSNATQALAYASSASGEHQLDVFNGTLDLSTLRGAVLLAGYGRDFSQMLTAQQFELLTTLE